ncbi:MAG: aspartate aminotransferase family protein [Ignavibacteria bacterium]|nr:aspartate aminotransferase family protein [Ignavibacteria bacterium]MBI3765656.1 aspartate aminotransferase family protein [Ignavibacteriales bacterium]
MTKKAFVKTEIPGPRSKEIFDFEQQYISPGTQTIATLSQLVMDKGEGCVMQDVDGNRYIDFFAGVAVSSLGYNHPNYVKAMQEQVAKIHVGSFTTKVRADLSKLLADHAVGDLYRTQYYSGGAEAVEAALRLAKSYTKKTEVIGFWGGFHGKTLGVVGLIGDDFKHQLGPLPHGIYNTPYANCRRCPLNHTFPECEWACVDFIKQKIKVETTNNIAAIIVEPIQGTNGNVVPPAGYLQELRRVANEIGALLIVDEMITGFGRTGKLFGCQHDDVIPDIITIGKSFGGGYPMTGLMSNDKIIFSKPFANPSGSSSSYGGNPLASAAAYVTVKTIIDEGLVENSANVGAFMLNKLMAFKDKFPFVGDVRGRGLLIGVELVKNRNTKELLDKETCKIIFKECLKRGLIVMGYNPSIRINPPLIIDKATAEEGIDIMDEVFTHVADRINL